MPELPFARRAERRHGNLPPGSAGAGIAPWRLFDPVALLEADIDLALGILGPGDSLGVPVPVLG